MRWVENIRWLTIIFLLPTVFATTYYVRPNGGDNLQCNGLANNDYSGNNNCAFNHLFWLLTPGGTSLLKGGDTVIIASGSYKIGYGAPNTGACSSYYPWDCGMPAIPSGIAGQPTRILGQGWDSGCQSPPELYGVERAGMINLKGSSNVELQCLELTDHSTCVEFHSGSITCNRDAYPFGEWVSTGISASDSSNVLLRNLNIHGFAHTGVYAGRLNNWNIDWVRIAGNGWVGWDGDIDGDDSNTGTIRFTNVTIEWNGCGETYPGEQPIGCWGQTAGGYGDGLGTGATGGDWIFEDCTFLHSTSDGLDLLYHGNSGTITIRRMLAEGNAGNQIKVSGQARIENSIVISDCGFFQGKSFTHHVDNCRAGGAAISFNAMSSAPIVESSTIYSEGDCMMTGSCDTGGSVIAKNSIFYGGVDFNQNYESSCYYWTDSCGALVTQNSIVFTSKNYQCKQGVICQDPKFIKVLKDDFDLRLQSTSPAIDKGVTNLKSDFYGISRPQGSAADIGAVEYASGSCVSNWQCGNWGQCYSGMQERDCIDQNGCLPVRVEEQSCSTACAHESDHSPCDGCVNNDELLLYLNKWKSSQASMSALMEAIRLWKSGC